MGRDPDTPEDLREELFLRYGTVSRSFLSACEMALGNWGPPTWMVVNHVSEWFMPLILAFKLTAGFAVLNVVNAVFLRQTMKCADTIDEFTINARAKARANFSSMLLELFQQMDQSGDGLLSKDE